MKLKPVYNYFSHSLMSNNTGLEYYPKSDKALSIVHLANNKKHKQETYGFLFTGVISISQKVKNEFNMNKIGYDDDIGMLHFLYYSDLESENKRYVFQTEESFIIVEAKSVELIEGLMFM